MLAARRRLKGIGAAGSQEGVEIGLDLRDARELQPELASIGADDVFHFREAALEIGRTPVRRGAAVTYTAPIAVIADGPVNVRAFSHRLKAAMVQGRDDGPGHRHHA